MAPTFYFYVARAGVVGMSQSWGWLVKKGSKFHVRFLAGVPLLEDLKNVFHWGSHTHCWQPRMWSSTWCSYFFSSLEPPNSLDLNDAHPRRIKLTAPNINLSLDQSEGSILSDDNLDSPDEIDINVDELDTPDEADSFEYTGHGKWPSGQGQSYVKSERLSKGPWEQTSHFVAGGSFLWFLEASVCISGHRWLC